MSDIRQRSPSPGPRHRGVCCQTGLPAAQGGDGTAGFLVQQVSLAYPNVLRSSVSVSP
jgi:hypothetical protein